MGGRRHKYNKCSATCVIRMHVRIVFFDIFRLPCICCGCISVSEAQSGTGCTAHCPGSLHRHILLSISTLPDLLSGLLVASSASSGIRKKCIPDSVRCLEQLSIQFISCIANKVNKHLYLSCETRCSCHRLHACDFFKMK